MYDQMLDKVNHYIKYPQLKPYIGENYSNTRLKLLVVGESHYLSKKTNYHHDPVEWYKGIDISDDMDDAGIKTRNIIIKWMNNECKRKSRVIYRNIEKALFDSDFFKGKPDNAFSEIAFMNFFQRPAEINGKSIIVSDIDLTESNKIFSEVVNIIQPDSVIFTSSLAYKAAKKGGTLNQLKARNITFTRTPHPGTSWWNRISKAYSNKTGKLHFIEFINAQVRFQDE